MPLVFACLQYALIGIVVFGLSYVVTVVPGSESKLTIVRVGSLAWTLGFGIVAALVFWTYLRNPENRLFTTRWPRLLAQAVWLLLAGMLVFGVIV